MNDFGPKWILGQPSVIFLLSKYLEKHNLKLSSVKYIELNGEFVENSIYKSIKKIFNVPVSNLYGSVEFNGIALTCPSGNMHILNGNVYIESDLSNCNNLIITGLVNTFMPLIKYNLGDSGTIIKDFKCPCGICGDLLNLSHGRSHELIQCTKEMHLDPVIFSNIVDELNCYDNVVLRYSLLVGKCDLILQLCIDEKFVDYVKSRKIHLINKLSEFIPPKYNFNINLETAEENMTDGSSKYTFIKDIK